MESSPLWMNLTKKMSVPFIKYSGCANDFVLIDNRKLRLSLPTEKIIALCNRRDGIGADGVILIEPSQQSTCKMRIYNADGGEAEMCGNGIRCVAHFIRMNGHKENTCSIESMNRYHDTSWDGDKYTVEMGPPERVCWDFQLKTYEGEYSASFMDTGVPHIVIFVDEVASFPLHQIAPSLRYHETFMPAGANVNIAKVSDKEVSVRTYERGVEDETPACGTGATACALAAAKKYGIPSPIKILLQSGDSLEISYAMNAEQINSVAMTGGCKKVFEGTIPNL
ncbi:MAG: diaminopimelate epimerase [Chlamydiota bacterium]